MVRLTQALPRPFRLFARAAIVLGCAGWIQGCVSQVLCDGPTGPCVETGGANEAAVTAAVAGAAWIGGGGCAIAGCRPPFVCNATSGLCEHVRCGENGGPCPAGTRCDSATRTCR